MLTLVPDLAEDDKTVKTPASEEPKPGSDPGTDLRTPGDEPKNNPDETKKIVTAQVDTPEPSKEDLEASEAVEADGEDDEEEEEEEEDSN